MFLSAYIVVVVTRSSYIFNFYSQVLQFYNFFYMCACLNCELNILGKVVL